MTYTRYLRDEVCQILYCDDGRSQLSNGGKYVSVSAEGVTLFSEGSGTVHHGGGHHSYNVGVLGHLVKGMGLEVLFRFRVNQNQVIYWTQGEGAVSLSYFRIIR